MSTTVEAKKSEHHGPPARLVEGQGRWLVVARVGWIVTTVVVLGLYALALPHVIVLSQSICAAGAPCLGIQLTPRDLLYLHRLGLTQGGFAAYQVGWDVATLLLYVGLGVLLFLRRSREPMPLFCAYVLVLYGGASYTQVLDYGLRPLGSAWPLVVGVVEVAAQVGYLAFFLVLPNGRFVPRWSRWLIPVIVLSQVQYIFFTSQLNNHDGTIIPFLTLVVLVVTILCLQVYRFRRVSTPREREQTKWLLYGFAVALGGFIVSNTVENFVFPPDVLDSVVGHALIGGTIAYTFLALIPVSITVAVLRSRLWDIDILINRTLVYGSLTALLAGVYFGSVVLLQTLARALTGAQSESALAIVVSTLLIAALFQPLRTRLQQTIDRRFYRQKYDAAKTLSRFAETLRGEVELADLEQHLIGVVEETMQPAHISLWIAVRNGETR